MDDIDPTTRKTKTARFLRAFYILGITCVAGAVLYPLSSGPVIWAVHQSPRLSAVREPIETMYLPLMSGADALGADILLNKYLARFDATMDLRRRHVAARIVAARELLYQGRVDAADRLAGRIQKWDVQYGLFDDRPGLVQGSVSRVRAGKVP